MPWKGHLEGEQPPQLEDLLIIVANYLQTGMILQVQGGAPSRSL